MTQTNTTQNKEELEQWEEKVKSILENIEFLHGVPVSMPPEQINKLISIISKLLSQAHQSGIEEERKRIKTNIGFLRQWLNEKPEKMLVTNEDLEEWLFNFEPTKKNETS